MNTTDMAVSLGLGAAGGALAYVGCKEIDKKNKKKKHHHKKHHHSRKKFLGLF